MKNLGLYHEPGNEDGPWMLVCERHGTCINFETRAAVNGACEIDFCEACVQLTKDLDLRGVYGFEEVDGVRVVACLSCMTAKPETAFPTVAGKPGVRDTRACRACR